MSADVSTAQPMAASSASPLNSNGGVLVNAGRPTSEEQSLGGASGFVAGVMAGRRLRTVDVSHSPCTLLFLTEHLLPSAASGPWAKQGITAAGPECL